MFDWLPELFEAIVDECPRTMALALADRQIARWKAERAARERAALDEWERSLRAVQAERRRRIEAGEFSHASYSA